MPKITQAKCNLFAWVLLIYVGSTGLWVSTSHAADAILNIGANIIQCGPRTNLIKACEEKEICCAFLDSYQIADTLHITAIEEDSTLDSYTNAPEQPPELVLE